MNIKFLTSKPLAIVVQRNFLDKKLPTLDGMDDGNPQQKVSDGEKSRPSTWLGTLKAKHSQVI